MNEYKAKLVKVVDAVTLNIEIDLGFKVRMTKQVKLSGCECEPRSTKDGRRLLIQVKRWFEKYGENLFIRSSKPDEHGRYWCNIQWDDGKDELCLNSLLLGQDGVKRIPKRR